MKPYAKFLAACAVLTQGSTLSFNYQGGGCAPPKPRKVIKYVLFKDLYVQSFLYRICRPLLVVGVALASGLSALSAAAAAVPQGPDGAAFYVPPHPLPAGKPGSAIWQRPLTGTMALPSAGKNWLVLYRSRDPAAKVVPVSGTVSIPSGVPPKGGWPVINWTHGTTGLAPVCAPSLDTADGPEHPYIQQIQTLLDGFVRRGYAVVATDYQGLGVAAGHHPFLMGEPNGQNALDLLSAAREVAPHLGQRYAVVGHSQGGQASLFTAALGAQYAADFKLVGAIAFAPGSHVAARLDTVMKSTTVELALPYVMYVLESYAEFAPGIDLQHILQPQAIAHLPDLRVSCMTHALSTGYWSKAIAKDQFVARPELAAFLKVGAANEPGKLSIAAPTLVMQGSADTTVRPLDTDDVAKQLCAQKNVLEYKIATGADHDGVMVAEAAYAQSWLDARFAGKPAASNCAALPSQPSSAHAK